MRSFLHQNQTVISSPPSPNPYRVATVMKGHFPRVHYYLCSQLGALTVRDCAGRAIHPSMCVCKCW